MLIEEKDFPVSTSNTDSLSQLLRLAEAVGGSQTAPTTCQIHRSRVKVFRVTRSLSCPPLNPALEYHYAQTRRQFFHGAGLKLGGLALASTLASVRSAASKEQVSPPLPGLPISHPSEALIYLHMNGAPSQQICSTTSRSCEVL